MRGGGGGGSCDKQSNYTSFFVEAMILQVGFGFSVACCGQGKAPCMLMEHHPSLLAVHTPFSLWVREHAGGILQSFFFFLTKNNGLAGPAAKAKGAETL